MQLRSTPLFEVVAIGDSLDWKDLSAEDIHSRVMKRLSPGSIMLFHNGAKNTPAALRKIIPDILSAGYKIVPVSEIIYNDNYTIDNSGKQIKADSSHSEEPIEINEDNKEKEE